MQKNKSLLGIELDNRIHKYKQGDLYIILDICSGGVHSVDETVYNMIDYIEAPMSENCPESVYAALPQYNRKEISECYGELYGLYKAGALFSDDEYRKFADMKLNAPIKALCLHVSHDCNLRCKYCFAETGDFGTGRKIMPVETGKKAIDFLIEKSTGRENLELDFFGGEPLMAWETVVETVKYARSIEKQHGKNFRFTMTTNGVLLDDEKKIILTRKCQLRSFARREKRSQRPYPRDAER